MRDTGWRVPSARVGKGMVSLESLTFSSLRRREPSVLTKCGEMDDINSLKVLTSRLKCNARGSCWYQASSSELICVMIGPTSSGEQYA